MANFIDYLKWRGDLTFKQSAFNEVDNLILAQLSYVEFGKIIPPIGSRERIPLYLACKKFFRQHTIKELQANTSFIAQAPFLMKEMANHQRFANVYLSQYVNFVDEKKEIQFSAFVVTLGDGSNYVAFSGTDDTIVGWKENFNMSFLSPVPAQIASAKYLDVVAKICRGKIRIGGHSKGGNLAVYSAVKAQPKVKRRILEVYCNDGPGFDKKFVNSPEYIKMLPKIKAYVPEQSIIGILLEHSDDFTVIASSNSGVMQHDATSWQVLGSHFETCRHLSRASRNFQRAFSKWIGQIDIKERTDFVNTLFSIISASGAKNLSELNSNMFGTMTSTIKALTAMEPTTRSMMLRVISALTGEYSKAVKESKQAANAKKKKRLAKNRKPLKLFKK